MNLLEIVSSARSVALTGHEKPDGDAVGSCLALAMYLQDAFAEQGRTVRIDVFLEPYADSLKKNIPGQEFVRTAEEAEEIIRSGFSYDVFFVLDTGSGRLGRAQAVFDGARMKVNIDHHVSNPGCGDVNEVDGSCSSTGEMLYRLMDASRIDRRIAQALYVCVVTDTGVFRYSNTTPSTLELGAALMRSGFDFSAVVQEVFFEKTFIQQKILGFALTNSRLICGGRAVMSSMSREELSSLMATADMIEGISSELILTAGSRCAAFLHEDRENEWRVSLRSGKHVDVSKMAERLGGGGHIRAAGCTLYGTRQEAERLVETEMARCTGT